MNKKRGMFLVALLVFIIVNSLVVLGAKHGDNKWADFSFNVKDDLTLFKKELKIGDLPSELEKWNVGLSYDQFQAMILTHYNENDIFVSDTIDEDKVEFFEDDRGVSIGGGSAKNNYANTHIFVTWVYVNQTKPTPTVKTVNVESHDDDLAVYLFTCGDQLTGCSNNAKKYTSSKSGSATFPLDFVNGWNVVVMILDDDGGVHQNLIFKSSQDLLSNDKEILFLGSRWELSDVDNDKVLDWLDKCPNTPKDEADKVVKDSASPVDGCSASQKSPDGYEDICNLVGGNFVKDLKGENKCCGNKFTDFGQIVPSPDGGEYICLNKDADLVGREDKDIPGWSVTDTNDPNNPKSGCPGDWCWVKSTGQPQYKVLTIKKPGEEPYDVVSNIGGWYNCNATSSSVLPSPVFSEEVGETDITSSAKIANRYYCYQEGNHWSWAECHGELDPNHNPGIKGRYTGEGLYSLSTPGADKLGEKFGVSIQVNAKDYINFYGKDYSFDFTGYDYLEFMVKFVAEDGIADLSANALKLPVGVLLIIYGPDTQDINGKHAYLEYYNQDVLGYATNPSQLTEGGWMHIKVPVNEFKGIKKMVISSSKETNTIRVKNIYLTKDGSPPALCSGKESETTSSWLTDLDQSGSDTYITGEDLCTKLYGDDAWLGDYETVEDNTKRCCGNNEHEYYSGTSKYNSGCWNSQVIAANQTTMNIEAEVEYHEKNVTVSYSPVVFTAFVKTNYQPTDCNQSSPIFGGYFDSKCNPEDAPLNLLSLTYFYYDISTSVGSKLFLKLNKFKGSKIDSINNKKYTSELSSISVISDNPKVTLNLWSDSTGTIYNELTSEDLPGDIYLIAETDDGITVHENQLLKTKVLTYSCNQEECLYPLPGSPPYTIKNTHPELYQLYFVNGTKPTDETLIANDAMFNTPGNIKVKKVAQQVIFADQAFYGCQAADYLNVENKPYCSVLGGKFCAPSTTYTSGKKDYVTINSWSNESITKVGYDTDNLPPPQDENISAFYDQLKLNLKDANFGPELRNHSAMVLPAKNFISNTEFEYSLSDKKAVSYWSLFNSLGNIISTKEKVSDKIIYLEDGETLTSERVAVDKNVNLHYSQQPVMYSTYIDTECIPNIYLVDLNGNKQEVTNMTFNTGDNSYVMLEFKGGPCQVQQPMLQLVDDLGIVDYKEDYTPESLERSGLACCPEDYCWNGYACVEEMSNLTFLSEHISEGRDYRCIKGKWEYLPLKWDWNNQYWGFCSHQNECFVSSFGKNYYTANDFYNGDYPLCINYSEYIFDHYCQEGNWGSRTQLLADELMNISSNKDYVLYCADYRKTMLDYQNVDSYLGDEPVLSSDKPALGESASSPVSICFVNLTGDLGKKLIPEEDNTCINKICVLKYKEGSKFKVAFATTLNKPLDDSSSFLMALNIPQNKLKDICKSTSDNKFIECNLQILEEDIGKSLWYSKELNALIYSKEGISLTYSFWDNPISNVVSWVTNLFKTNKPSLSLHPSKVISLGGTLYGMYMLKTEDRRVQAVWKNVPKDKQAIVARYEGFTTPVCDYLKPNHLDYPSELQSELLETSSGMDKWTCTKEGNTQLIEAVVQSSDKKGLEFLWPQLTGMLRPK